MLGRPSRPVGAVVAEATDSLAIAFTCAPGQGAQASSTACLEGADCQSGACEGTARLKLCILDGRTCTSDDDCALQCVDFGVAGGVCR